MHKVKKLDNRIVFHVSLSFSCMMSIFAVLCIGNKDVKSTNCSLLPNKDHLIHILSKINTLPLPLDLEAKLPTSASSSKTVPEQASLDNQSRLNGTISSSSTKDLLAVLSATLAAPSSKAVQVSSQSSSQVVDANKTLDQALSLSMKNRAALEFPSVGGERSSSSYQSPVEDSDCQVQVTGATLPLQLFSSSPEDDSPPNLATARKYFSSDSSNPIEETSPSSSPSAVQKLFPMQTTRATDPQRISKSGEIANVETSKARDCETSLQLFGRSNRGLDHSSFQSYPYQAGYTSSSGSDHSPSSSNSDAQVVCGFYHLSGLITWTLVAIFTLVVLFFLPVSWFIIYL